ncbi:PAS domain S-box protein [Ammoniphilus sp. CFH 90114]|uniref:PAS domain S-box protein n=1 Tax=Ammoniphilus sp. CFH 90114 TaxID=2493665 RepID=UPI00100F994F|nr:PAS domain S-box protein [Ammoniphilus sp. CFH 90114]RXT04538.1 PAS domain S-box protein [Ammoniphilus sp. CFH 90114]
MDSWLQIPENTLEQQYSWTKRKLQQILDTVDVAIWSMNEKFEFIFCSKGYENIFGVSTSFIQENPSVWKSHIHPDDLVIVEEGIKTLQKGEQVVAEYRIRNYQTNIYHWIQVRATPILDQDGHFAGLDGVTTDITDRKKMEQRLIESEQRYRSFFYNHADAAYSLDLTGRFVEVNQQSEKLTSFSREELLQMTYHSVIMEDDLEQTTCIFKSVIEQGLPQNAEVKLICKDNSIKQISFCCIPITVNHQIIGVHGVAKDITEQKRAEIALIQSEERYRSLHQSINRFLQDIHHLPKSNEVENRLIQEIRDVLKINDIGIIEMNEEKEIKLINGSLDLTKLNLPHYHAFIKQSLLINQFELKDEIAFVLGNKNNKLQILILRDKNLLLELDTKLDWLHIVIRYVQTLFDNFGTIEDLMRQLEAVAENPSPPRWVLKLLFNLSEKERIRLSADLHDSALQKQLLYYRRLNELLERKDHPPSTEDLIEFKEGLLEVIYQIRRTCHELRPPFIKEMGLKRILERLIKQTQPDRNYQVFLKTSLDHYELREEITIQLYRIVQELLNNATKHSNASEVKIEINCEPTGIYLIYLDNGVGMKVSCSIDNFTYMGISGMKRRVEMLEGEFEIHSVLGRGVNVFIYIPH